MAKNVCWEVLRYLKGTATLSIVYHFGKDLILLGYSDASWAGDKTIGNQLQDISSLSLVGSLLDLSQTINDRAFYDGSRIHGTFRRLSRSNRTLPPLLRTQSRDLHLRRTTTRIYRPSRPYVLLLNKGLYGLKQSGCCWSNHVKNKLTAFAFQQSDADESLFIRQPPL